MKFTEFKIKNFKGIEDITINLDKSPNANIYTIVGLNESGKTTILEAINCFNPNLSALKHRGAKIKHYNSLIPISHRDNFNDTISIEVTLKLDDDDLRKINKFTAKNTLFNRVRTVNTLKYYNYYSFNDSKFTKSENRWSGFDGWLKAEMREKYVHIGDELYDNANLKLARFCSGLIPSILFFPNFLFDFPLQISLETKEEPNPKEKFYIDLIQDILHSLENDTNIKTHLIDRIKSLDEDDKKSLESLLKQMEQKVTNVVFDAWKEIFKREIKDTKIAIHYNKNSKSFPYLEFDIEEHDGTYNIKKMSLGFRWIFTFLLFTQFRTFRKDTPNNIIFLFDEPGSNLDWSAQKQLLKSFENLGRNIKIIYTTHNHHLINPNWLESTYYLVKNKGLELESPESNNAKKTISIEPYREFAIKHPNNIDYVEGNVIPNQSQEQSKNPIFLKIFLCHSSGDKPAVRNLYQQLKANAFIPWLDEENLLPGQDWQIEIPKAVKESNVVIVCLSQSSTTKEGYVQKEIKYALDVADEKPEGTIFIIPLRLEECNVSERLSRWQWVNLYEDNGFEKLKRALQVRENQLKKK